MVVFATSRKNAQSMANIAIVTSSTPYVSSPEAPAMLKCLLFFLKVYYLNGQILKCLIFGDSLMMANPIIQRVTRF